MALVDVLIPVYNRPEFLSECLDSILCQTIKDLKIVVYDDGSTTEYKLPRDRRIKFIRDPVNRGIPYARNQLLDEVRSPFAAWQDSDDTSRQTRLEEQIELIEKSRSDIVFTYYYHRRGMGHIEIEPSRYAVEGPASLQNNMAFPTALFRHDLKLYRFPDQRMTREEDMVWLTQLILAGKKFDVVTKPLYRLRRHKGRTSLQPLARFEQNDM